MKSLYLVGKKTVELDGNEVTLNYCLVEEMKTKGKSLYGIKIFQEEAHNAMVEYSEPLSYSKDYVLNILSKLIQNKVLISNFIETVDLLVS